ncbi:MAG: hypothetical protein AMXMBFR4_01690 [Candidatus Hydrogenedentota bacterium]
MLTGRIIPNASIGGLAVDPEAFVSERKRKDREAADDPPLPASFAPGHHPSRSVGWSLQSFQHHAAGQ